MVNPIETDKKSLEVLLHLEAGLSLRLSKLSADMSKSHSRDSGEQAVERENDEVVFSLENETKKELKQVQDAITRIDRGKYHECSSCGGKISPERLDAIPYTTRCIKCAAG